MEEITIKLKSKNDLAEILKALGVKQRISMTVDEDLSDLIIRLSQQALELE